MVNVLILTRNLRVNQLILLAGPCGDDYADKRPRENENGGRFGRGIIARTYKPGQVSSI